MSISNRKKSIVAAQDEYLEIRKESFNRQMSITKELNEDYIQTCESNCCEKCTPYRNRIYSISGKDKRFPKFSDYIKEPEKYCCLAYFAVFYNNGDTITEYRYDEFGNVSKFEVDAIKHSNRPFVDDRSLYQKEMFVKVQEQNEKRRKHDEKYYSREHWIEKYHKKQANLS